MGKKNNNANMKEPIKNDSEKTVQNAERWLEMQEKQIKVRIEMQ